MRRSTQPHLGPVVIAVAAMTSAIAQPQAPVLRYEPPPNFYHSAITPDDYSSNEANASVQIYPFRQFSGNIEQMFQKSLLREWIDPRHQESSVAGQPEFARSSFPGAQAVFTARFVENIVGIPRPHMRMVIVASNTAAIVDASAINATSWQRTLPALNRMAATIRVESEALAPAITEGPGLAGRDVAGLYMGTKPKYMVNLNRPVGSGSFVTALHYYLFSADGRVYRAFDQLVVPGGNIARFDFDAAQRADAVNSGRYTVTGNQLRIQMGGPRGETITAPLPKDNRVTINTVVYVRQ